MGKSKPDRVVVHRLELNTYERNQLNTYIRVQGGIGAVKAASGLLAGGGLVLGAMALGYFVGLPLKEKINDAINEAADVISDSIVNTGVIQTDAQGRAVAIGIERDALITRATVLHDNMATYCDTRNLTFNRSQCDATQAELTSNIDRQEVLFAELDDIATGKTKANAKWWDTILDILDPNQTIH